MKTVMEWEEEVKGCKECTPEVLCCEYHARGYWIRPRRDGERFSSAFVIATDVENVLVAPEDKGLPVVEE